MPPRTRGKATRQSSIYIRVGRDQQKFRHPADKSVDEKFRRARAASQHVPGLAGELLKEAGRHLREYGSLEKLLTETFVLSFSVYTLAEVESALERE
jgi:hypothetical protein